MTLSQEEILSQLKTRGFEEGFQRTPLREFKGRLIGISGNMVDRMNPPRLEILYNFEEVVAIQSTIVYTDPIAQISIMQSTRKQSGMGVFGASIDKLLNQPDMPTNLDDGTPNPDVKGQDYLLNKIIHMKLTGGHMLWDGRAVNPANPSKPGAEVARECWEVIGIEEDVPILPKKAPAPTQVKDKPVVKGNMGAVIALVDGKTEQQFYNDFFKNATLKADGLLVTQVMGRKLLPTLLETEQVIKDEDGIYHKV